MENNTAVQDFEYVELSNLISKVSDLKAAAESFSTMILTKFFIRSIRIIS